MAKKDKLPLLGFNTNNDFSTNMGCSTLPNYILYNIDDACPICKSKTIDKYIYTGHTIHRCSSCNWTEEINHQGKTKVTYIDEGKYPQATHVVYFPDEASEFGKIGSNKAWHHSNNLKIATDPNIKSEQVYMTSTPKINEHKFVTIWKSDLWFEADPPFRFVKPDLVHYESYDKQLCFSFMNSKKK